jgi:hypothetical protein
VTVWLKNRLGRPDDRVTLVSGVSAGAEILGTFLSVAAQRTDRVSRCEDHAVFDMHDDLLIPDDTTWNHRVARGMAGEPRHER